MLKKDVDLSKMDYARRESGPIFIQTTVVSQNSRVMSFQKLNSIHRSYQIGALVTLFLIVIIAARPSEQNNLEQRVADLERRVARLEQIKGVSPATSPAPQNTNRGFENIENWRRLRTDMTPSQVEAILGKPSRIDGGNVAIWYYSNNRISGTVRFMNDKLFSWSEPR